MNRMSEQRKYQRCKNTVCTVSLSTDRKLWHEIEVSDISAGGLKFFSATDYRKESTLYFGLQVFNGLSEFNLPLEGRVVRVETDRTGYTYAIQFTNVNRYHQIQLDEIIKSKITVKDINPSFADDGIHTFVLVPRAKHRRVRAF